MPKKIIVDNKDDKNKEQEVQQKLVLYQLLQKQLEEFKRQGMLLQSKFTEFESTRLALEDLDKSKNEKDILIPLGSGIFINGRTKQEDLIIDVGAGVMTRKPLSEASRIINEKKKEIETLSDNLQQNVMGVVAKINEIGEDLQRTMAQSKK